jgi:hypothetical protein
MIKERAILQEKIGTLVLAAGGSRDACMGRLQRTDKADVTV